MDEKGETSLQGARRELVRSDATYNYRQVWPPLDAQPELVPLPMGLSPEAYVDTFASLELANFRRDVAEAVWDELIRRPRKRWYHRLVWWTVLIPAMGVAIQIVNFWVFPPFQHWVYLQRKHPSLNASSYGLG
ncbi:hypothetical protein F5Y19DRAFT_469248 [Xylariaceae sp. FL1651]|nr:hypothetical protein F5Y19DRAFT_469248 [Xylariaceae sp. FL1651]